MVCRVRFFVLWGMVAFATFDFVTSHRTVLHAWNEEGGAAAAGTASTHEDEEREASPGGMAVAAADPSDDEADLNEAQHAFLACVAEEAEAQTGKLVFSLEKLYEVPPGVSLLGHLLELHLIGNSLSTLPDELATLTCLKTLDVRDNLFSVFPPIILQLLGLEHLDISFNNLRVLPDEISRLANLRTLRLRGNALRFLPETITALASLEGIAMGHNPLLEVPRWRQTREGEAAPGILLDGCTDLVVIPASWGERLWESGSCAYLHSSTSLARTFRPDVEALDQRTTVRIFTHTI
jgi:hypothetical protein